MTHRNRMSTQLWMPEDESGHGYDMMIFDGGNEYSGKVNCNILRKAVDGGSGRGILYIHSVTDTPFQKEMDMEFNRHGFDFYAVDLRGKHRKLHPGEAKTEERELRDYFDFIRAGIDTMKRDGVKEIILFGHCTGALSVILFMEAYAGEDTGVSAMILNSPFLSYNKIFENDGGAWQKAVDIAAKALEKGSAGVPALVMQSDKSTLFNGRPAENVTLFKVYDGEVDVPMTEPDVKAVAYTEIFSWLEARNL